MASRHLVPPRAARMRNLIGLLLIAAVASACQPVLVPTGPVLPTTPTTAPARTVPKLIKHGSDVTYPHWYTANAAKVRSRAAQFDGFTTAYGSDGMLFSTNAVSRTTLTSQLSGMGSADFGDMEVWPRVSTVSNPTPDWFNDAHWATVASNFGNLAAVSAAQGFGGIFWDPEQYGGGVYPWNFGTASGLWTYSSTQGATPGRTQAAAVAKVQQRGREVMNAILATWPSGKVVFLYGPWVSQPGTAAGLASTISYNNVSASNELYAPFFFGMADAIRLAGNKDFVLMDGGEEYDLITPTEFGSFYDMAKTGMMAQSSVQSVPAGLAGPYGDLVSVSFGLYDRDETMGYAQRSATSYRSMVTSALNKADDMVWAYTEGHDWWGSGFPAAAVPQTWLDAVAAGRAAATGR